MKLGFICEGKTEKKIIESQDFQQILRALSLECVEDIVDAKGNGNLLPHNLFEESQRLLSKGADRVIIITDLDEDACITSTKQRIAAPNNHIIIIAVKAIEAWFLADSAFMTWICETEISIEEPESFLNPFQYLRGLLLEKTGKGIQKIVLARRAANNNFSIRNAAAHPACPSAKYFLDKLEELARI